MKKLLISLVCSYAVISCVKLKTPEPHYLEKWSLIETKTADEDWRKIKVDESLILYFQSDSALRVETDSTHCSGTYSTTYLDQIYFDKVLTIYTDCLTPAPHMWWTYQVTSPKDNVVEALPRLNPTAYLSNVSYRFLIEKNSD